MNVMLDAREKAWVHLQFGLSVAEFDVTIVSNCATPCHSLYKFHVILHRYTFFMDPSSQFAT